MLVGEGNPAASAGQNALWCHGDVALLIGHSRLLADNGKRERAWCWRRGRRRKSSAQPYRRRRSQDRPPPLEHQQNKTKGSRSCLAQRLFDGSFRARADSVQYIIIVVMQKGRDCSLGHEQIKQQQQQVVPTLAPSPGNVQRRLQGFPPSPIVPRLFPEMT